MERGGGDGALDSLEECGSSFGGWNRGICTEEPLGAFARQLTSELNL